MFRRRRGTRRRRRQTHDGSPPCSCRTCQNDGADRLGHLSLAQGLGVAAKGAVGMEAMGGRRREAAMQKRRREGGGRGVREAPH